MNVLRGLLFDNLGLKLAALLLALLVYLNVYLDRPAEMTISFPIQVQDLDDSLSLSGPVPSTVQAQVRGTGKQLLRMRVTEPPVRVSLEGIGAGRFERQVSAEDLPLAGYEGVEVDRVIGPRVIDIGIERTVRRRLPAAPRVEGVAASGTAWAGVAFADPASVLVSGPRSVVARLDSVVLQPVRLGARRDTVRAQVAAQSLPDWCTMDPPLVKVTVPLVRRTPRGASAR
jgi:YbbR domain-containing protein